MEAEGWEGDGAAASSSIQGTGFRVFVGDLPGDCLQEELMQVFSTYGKVNHIHMMRPGLQTGMRCAFVYYDSEEAALDSVQALDGVYSIRRDVAQPIRVKRSRDDVARASSAAGGEDGRALAGAQQQQPQQQQQREQQQQQAVVQTAPQPASAVEEKQQPPKVWESASLTDTYKLFIGYLPPDIKEEELKVVFGHYGSVARVSLMAKHPTKGRCAFVHYTDKEDAKDAIQVLHNIYVIRPEGWPYPMEVRWANKRAITGTGWNGGSWDASWASSDWQQPDADWDSTWSYDGWDWEDGDSWSNGWWQESPRSWSSAAGKGKKGKVPTRCPNCGFILPPAWEIEGTATSSAASTAVVTAAPVVEAVPPAESVAPEAPSTRVHVYHNLPDEIDDKQLRFVFSRYGEVASVTVDKGKAGPGLAHAFVDFTSAFDAETSVLTLDNVYEIKKDFGPLRLKFVSAPSAPY